MKEKNTNYLVSLFYQNPQEESFTEAEMKTVRYNLISLLGERTDRYTMNESSSVPIEKAEELLKSICFTIGLVVKKQGNSSLKTENMSTLLKSGWNIIETKLEEGKELLKQVTESGVITENISYRDTVQGIEKFFTRYDYRFFAHEIPCDIDYQLCIPLSDHVMGVEYINEYLFRLLMENRFCKHFKKEIMVQLLQCYCPDYRELLINVFEPVAMNAMGCALANKDVRDLDISDYDRKNILRVLENWPEEEVDEQLSKVVDVICSQLDIKDDRLHNYLYQALLVQYPRVQNQVHLKKLEGIFLSLAGENQEGKITSEYEDGEMMDDEQLRALIDAINNSGPASDKIKLVKQHIHSLRDMTEILNICFWEEEIMELLQSFSDTELVLLQEYVKNKPALWKSETGWEIQLENLINNIR
ncbi:DUF6179 domain-containing protein [Aminipila terrae]|uniref:Uncharacterized protein n=1 Tax=Aminipila terrae TaxID=2697030 RepID=A0A6P1MKA2_9FIRM|nr:DUF6179 domain-containing protein [Aminipila terrae]QHI73573.1 hypothetical protein Ami3637_15380 [Aminipila terrae]